MGGTKWTADEDKIILNNIHLYAKELQELLPGRSTETIVSRRTKLGISKTKRVWSEEELKILKNNSNKRPKFISSLLPNKSIKDVNSKMIELGMVNRKNWSEEEVQILTNNKDLSIDELKLLLPNRTDKAINGKKKKLGLRSRPFWSQKEINILLKNKDKYPKQLVLLLPNKTAESISKKRVKLGISKKIGWSDTDAEFMIRNHEKGLTYCCRKLGKNGKTIRKHCKRLGIPISVYPTGERCHTWKGCGEISGSVWTQILWGAKIRDLEVDIDINYIWNLFIKQKRKCKLSGVDIVFVNKENETTERTASLDRIDSSQGYTEGNVQWIHKDLQTMKWDKKQEDFISWCKIISEYNS